MGSMGGDDVIEVRIENSGNSISENELNNVFDPFYTKDKRGGTGLGLAICKQIINQHGGEIHAENLIGEFGIAFVFTLPVFEKKATNYNGKLPAHSDAIRELTVESVDHGNQIETENRILEISQQLGRNLKVLIADDEAVYRSIVIEQVLSNPNFATAIDFFEADTVAGAISLSEKIMPDIVIIDIDFGEKERDGFDALADMRAFGLKAKICMHSNRGHDEIADSCLAKGADGFLPKPMQLNAMFNFLGTQIQA
jgi:CheY-like chemotaxis protein